MSGHSILPPSSAARRVQCSGSVLFEQRYPEVLGDDDGDSANGVAAHHVLANTLHGEIIKEGDKAENGVMVTREMLECADVMIDDVRRVAPGAQLIIERPVAVPRTHPQCWGTPDLRFWHQGVLYVYDYKFGHRYHDVFEHWQLIEYASGALSEAGVDGSNDQHVEVEMVICQPRNYHPSGPVRRWRTNASKLRAQFNILSNAAHEALGPNPQLRVGPECRDCKARLACPALQKAGWAAMGKSESVIPVDMPIEAVALEARHLTEALGLLKARLSGLETQILASVRRGIAAPGWRVEHQKGRTVWNVPPAHVICMGQLQGVNVAKPVEPMTPKQAIDAGLDPAVVASLSHTPAGAAQLCIDNNTFTRRAFG